MGRKLDKLYGEMKEEIEGGAPAPEVKPEEAPENQQETRQEDPEDSGVPDTTPEGKTGPGATETPKDEPSPEDKPDDKPEESTDPKPRDIPDDPVKRAEFGFKRQLAKQKEKHAKELADRDARLADMQKQIDEMKKAMAPKEAPKTRDDFDNDEDFMKYLTAEQVKEMMASRDEEAAKKAAEQAEADRKAEEERAELEEKQTAWLANVDEAFGHDAERSRNFLSKVAYANKNGLGQVLDSCPVAADYLINDPMGPVVFEKLLTDRPTFERVFDPRRPNPLAVYRELRNVEDEIVAAAKAAQPEQQTPPAATTVKMGRPGRQAGGLSVTNTDMFSDPKLVKQYLRTHRH